jgi:hypothetical protein
MSINNTFCPLTYHVVERGRGGRGGEGRWQTGSRGWGKEWEVGGGLNQSGVYQPRDPGTNQKIQPYSVNHPP